MEYTKGEWACKSAGDGNISIYRTGDWYCGIADVLGDDAEAIANANLIVASKDMHEACSLVERAWVGDGVDMATAVDACLLAIAKAKGKDGHK